jgi:hypothetical protein
VETKCCDRRQKSFPTKGNDAFDTSDTTGNDDEEQNLVLNRLTDASVLRNGSHKITGTRRGNVDLKLRINDKVTNYGLKGRPVLVPSRGAYQMSSESQNRSGGCRKSSIGEYGRERR